MSLTLRRIRSFIAVAERGNFRKAADELATSQPALTAHVKDLEEFLGVALLHRTTRQVSLTNEGEVFLARSKRALAELDTVVEEIRQYAAVQRGRIVVGCTPSIAASLLPRALIELHRSNPGIEVVIYDDRFEVIERRMMTGEIDFAVGPAPQRSKELEFRHLVDDPFVALCPHDHPLGRRRTVRLQDLARYPLIAMRPGLSMRRELDRAFAERGYELQPAVEVFHHSTLSSFVEIGLGIGALPRLTLSITQPQTLKLIPIVDPEIKREIGVTRRAGETMSPACMRFIDAFRSILSPNQ